ncbi:OmpA family protein [Oricola sp.]|uniref:OmpA family protein n=1 Tax=Oricola sp. TaxID=1979950 RepID=UPI0025DB743B|nr:OmpA family protein [Oricola sp.]MCI5078661.1 OmpA family protein [Oricola sp.]
MHWVSKSILGLALAVLPASAAYASSECDALERTYLAALEDFSPDKVPALRQMLVRGATKERCTTIDFYAAFRSLALVYYKYAVAQQQAGLDKSEYRRLLNQANELGASPWQLLITLAQEMREDGKLEEAAILAQKAVNDISEVYGLDGEKTLDDLGETEKGYVEQVMAISYAYTALAGKHVQPQRTRSDGFGGLFNVGASRNASAVQMPLPITFEYDSDVLTDDGDKYVEDLGAFLKSTGLTEITIVGHTDPIGSDGYNCALGLKRARKVAQILRDEKGFSGTISARSAGEIAPINKDNPDYYDAFSEDEIHQLSRRVVLDLYGDSEECVE